ncbi:hypothetical protein V1478_016647 [Vespula squamosa]|uniref:Uncharacterized protein n=1 Tax=Vespula squamosa TaxID=30214 RepID=A0ABD2A0E3_VESSQ
MYIFASSLFGGSGQHRGPVYLFVNSGPEPTAFDATEDRHRRRRNTGPASGYFENRIAFDSFVLLSSQSTGEQMIQERKAPAPSSVRDSVYMNAFRNRSLFESVP